jgi:hypothetical protein
MVYIAVAKLGPEAAALRRAKKNEYLRLRWATDPEWRDAKKADHLRWTLENRERCSRNEKARRQTANLADGGRRFRDAKLRKNFGITLVEYEGILAAQGGVCGICRLPERSIDPRNGELFALAVDHDHTTGRIRGLLCANCNRGIGLFADDNALLLRAAAYVAVFLADTVSACDADSGGICASKPIP